MSLEVAIAFLEGRQDDFDAQVKEILALRPNYGEVYRVIGDHAARNYRFDEAVGSGAAGGRRSIPRTTAPTPISACTCCGRATKTARASGARAFVRARSTTW